MDNNNKVKLYLIDKYVDAKMYRLICAYFSQLESQKLAPNTLMTYCNNIKMILLCYTIVYQRQLSYHNFCKLDRNSLRPCLAELSKRNISINTKRHYLTVLRQFISWLAEAKGIKINLSYQIPAAKKPLPKVMLNEDLRKGLLYLINQQDDEWIVYRNQLIYLLLYASGLRISEALALQQKQIIPLPEYIKVVGKGNKQRITPLLPILEEYVYMYNHLCPYLPKGNAKEVCFFYGKKGGKLNPRVVQKLFRDMRVALNLSGRFTPHAMRHSYATHLLENGVDVRTIQMLLGHENLATTSIYTQVQNSHIKNVYQNCHPRAKIEHDY